MKKMSVFSLVSDENTNIKSWPKSSTVRSKWVREVCTSPACGKHIKPNNPWATTLPQHLHTRVKRGERVCALRVWVNEKESERKKWEWKRTHAHTLSLSFTTLNTRRDYHSHKERAGCTDPNSPPLPTPDLWPVWPPFKQNPIRHNMKRQKTNNLHKQRE